MDEPIHFAYPGAIAAVCGATGSAGGILLCMPTPNFVTCVECLKKLKEPAPAAEAPLLQADTARDWTVEAAPPPPWVEPDTPPASAASIRIKEGVRSFKVGDGPVFQVDIVRGWNIWIGIRNETDDKIENYSRLIDRLGGGRQHNGAEACAFMNAFCDAMDEVKKNTPGLLVSAGTTASTPSPSNPGKSSFSTS